MNYSQHIAAKNTPQSEPLPGQIMNSAGGYSFAVDDWVRLDRFLILGSEGGSYYATERKLTKENAEAVQRCLKADGKRVVSRIVEISNAGRAPKNDPALFALALAAKLGDVETRQAAFAALPHVARIGTHLFQFVETVKALGGFGRATMRAIADWYMKRPADSLALQLVKYQQRNGWSHRDLFRKAHPRLENVSDAHQALARWVVDRDRLEDQRQIVREKGEDAQTVVYPPARRKDLPEIIGAFEQALTLKDRKDVPELVRLIRDHNLPRECLPTEALGFPEVWEAMLPSMGVTGLVRNLGKMTSIGLLAPLSSAAKLVQDRLSDVEALRKGRVHPLALLVALRTYAQGHGDKGSLMWLPVQQVVDALDAAFYASFKAVEPTGKRTLLAVDHSGSMHGGLIAGMSNISPAVGAAAMALVTANVEPNHHIIGFSDLVIEPKVSPRMRLDQAVAALSGPPNGTDCALPILYALRKKIPVDIFVTLTDSETWAGRMHPAEAIKQYRKEMGIPAKVVTVAMVANGISVSDPQDAGSLDVFGFDTATPAVISDFARG